MLPGWNDTGTYSWNMSRRQASEEAEEKERVFQFLESTDRSEMAKDMQFFSVAAKV